MEIVLIGIIIAGLLCIICCLLVLFIINKQYTEILKDKLQDRRYEKKDREGNR